MKNVLGKVIGTVLLGCSLLVAHLFANPDGDWSGSIDLPNGHKLAIEVELSADATSEWKGKISIPAQGIRDFELSDVQVSKSEVGFAMEGVPGRPTFSGSLSEDEQKLEGDFSQGGQGLTFSLSRVTEPEEPETTVVPKEGIPGEGVVGEWMGRLKAGPTELRLALHLEEGDGGKITGSLDSLDQGVNGLAVSEVTFEDQKLEFSVKRVGGRFSGSLNDSGSMIEGVWEQNGRQMSLTFLRLEEPVSLHRPQDPQPPFPYEESEVSFRNEEAGIQLFGTLVIPEGDAPFPAVVFVSGSGPQDRDEAIAGHRPFAVLADALARCGIASLRYDDRGVGKSDGSYLDSTVNDFALDSLAAMRLLKTYPEIDTDWIGIVGHSEGGLVGPIAATLDSEVDFLVLLAPPVERLDELLIRQKSSIMSQLGIDADVILQLGEESRGEMKLLLDESLSDEEVKEEMLERYERYVQRFGKELVQRLGLSRETIAANVGTMRSEWFVDLMQTDPSEYLRKLDVPVLAVFGEKDIQVDAKVNSELLERISSECGIEAFQIEVLSNLNHLFQNSVSGSIQEYSTIEETFDPAAMEMICGWIGKLGH